MFVALTIINLVVSYADDIILLSPSIVELQKMLDLCHATCLERLTLFNVNKSHCIIFGYYCKRVSECLTFGSARKDWCTSLKYVGVNLPTRKTFTIDTDPLKRSFYAASNSIFSQTTTRNEFVSFSLQESYCLPILSYACAAISLKPKQAAELNACWNAVYRRIFGFNKWESVRTYGLDRLNLHSIFKLRKVNFYHQLCHSDSFSKCFST